MENSVLVLGAGAAGLAAAAELLRAGFAVTVLEARERIGGRIYTVLGRTAPVEAGAEFVHGDKNCTWGVIRSAKLDTLRVPDRHWTFSDGGLKRQKNFWGRISEVTGRLNTLTPDQDFQSCLDQAWGLSPDARREAKEYVEGFHAAPANRISVHSVAIAEAASEREGGTNHYKLREGYSQLTDRYSDELQLGGANIELNTAIGSVHWHQGHVAVEASSPTGARVFEASRCVVALPLGVLQAENGEGSVHFDPPLSAAHQVAIRSLGLGVVVKVILEFKSRFWPTRDFGFLHLPDASFPTWWSDGRGPILTAWAGGPKAEALRRVPFQRVFDTAIATLSQCFATDAQRIRQLLVAVHHHDWTGDPFARCAYSYTPERMTGMPRKLAEPLADTLYFAGEATCDEGDQGTVHGALGSGIRAARQVLESSRLSPAQELQIT